MSGGGGPVDDGGGDGGVFGQSSDAPVDLNLTALMDVLSNLLFFLLVSFGASVVMVINGATPVQSDSKTDVASTAQAVTVSVRLLPDRLECGAVGTAQTPEELGALVRTIPAKDGHPDYETFTAYLLNVKQKYPTSDTVILAPAKGVKYEELIAVMDAAREHDVMAGGKKMAVKLMPTVVVSAVVK